MSAKSSSLNIVAAVLAIIFITKIRKRAKVHDASFCSKDKIKNDKAITSRPKEKQRKLFRMGVSGSIFLVLAVISGTAGWLLFHSTDSGTPSAPSFPTGGLLVFTDQPHEHCTIYVNIQRSGFFEVSVSAPAGTDGKFLVVASGSAIVQPVNNTEMQYYPVGAIPDFSPGEIQTVRGGYGIASRLGKAFKGRFYGYEIHNYSGNDHVMMAAGSQFHGNYDENEKFLVFGKFKYPIFSNSGSTEAGGLPYIGPAQDMTSIISGGVSYDPVGPITINRTLSKTAQKYEMPTTSDSQEWYAPTANINISVTYPGSPYSGGVASESASTVPQDYRLDSATPPTIASGKMLWRSNTSEQVSWSVTNLPAAQNLSDRLFISGLVLGAAASFLGMSLDRSLREDLFAIQYPDSLIRLQSVINVGNFIAP